MNTAISTSRQSFFWGIMLVVFGLVLLLHNFNVISLGELIRKYWPVLLILLGLKMILFDRRGKSSHFAFSSSAPLSGTIENVNHINENRFLGDISLKVQSDKFQGGSVSVFVGDVQLDLSDVRPEGKGTLNISGFAGDVHLKPPKTGAYSISVSLFVGDLVLFDKKEDGIGLTRNFQTNDFDMAENRLNIRLSFFIGDLKVYPV